MNAAEEPQLDLQDIKARIVAGQHALDQDPGMHTDDQGAIWTQAYGDLWPRVHIPQLVAALEKAQAERDRAQDILVGAYSVLMISPQGYHPRGAAHKVFAMLMDNLDVINVAQQRQHAEKAAT